MNARVVLCRHASTEHNARDAFLSFTDLPLSAQGRAQCGPLRERIAVMTFDAAYVSPMRRARETLAAIAPGVTDEICEELREVNFGAWEGRTLEEIAGEDSGLLDARRRDPVSFRPPGGESFEDASARIAPFAHRLRSGGGRVLVVSHRGTLGVLERLLRGFDLRDQRVVPMAPAELRVIDVPSGVPFQYDPPES